MDSCQHEFFMMNFFLNCRLLIETVTWFGAWIRHPRVIRGFKKLKTSSHNFFKQMIPLDHQNCHSSPSSLSNTPKCNLAAHNSKKLHINLLCTKSIKTCIATIFRLIQRYQHCSHSSPLQAILSFLPWFFFICRTDMDIQHCLWFIATQQ